MDKRFPEIAFGPYRVLVRAISGSGLVALSVATEIARARGLRWHQTIVQTDTLSFAQGLLPKDVKLSRNGGSLSELLNGLGASAWIW